MAGLLVDHPERKRQLLLAERTNANLLADSEGCARRGDYSDWCLARASGEDRQKRPSITATPVDIVQKHHSGSDWEIRGLCVDGIRGTPDDLDAALLGGGRCHIEESRLPRTRRTYHGQHPTHARPRTVKQALYLANFSAAPDKGGCSHAFDRVGRLPSGIVLRRHHPNSASSFSRRAS
jgi:hypothetical protein